MWGVYSGTVLKKKGGRKKNQFNFADLLARFMKKKKKKVEINVWRLLSVLQNSPETERQKLQQTHPYFRRPEREKNRNLSHPHLLLSCQRNLFVMSFFVQNIRA